MTMKHAIDPKIDSVSDDTAPADTEIVPSWTETTEMRQATPTLRGFSEKEKAYHEYQARQNYLRVQHSIQSELDKLRTGEMRQAMTTLRTFSEKEQAYYVYQARQNYLRVQRSIQIEMDKLRTGQELALAREESALQREESALQREAAALAESERERLAKESALAESERERLKAEQERLAKEAALAELAQLKAQLAGNSQKE
ncbi:hypothetical protein [Chromatium okenii]|uniref:hypothetical protein n=1 Tax=Chromatium okenii TaxID=61644 RepID=UPI001F5B75B3|nr:hypothetical protein [Chromatium okenii]